MALPGHYRVLGIAQNATPVDIKKAYYRLALVHHPDKKAPGQAVDAEEFREIHDAYEVLSDALQRAKYDRKHASTPEELRRATRAEKKERAKTDKKAKRRAEATVLHRERKRYNEDVEDMARKLKAGRRAAEREAQREAERRLAARLASLREAQKTLAAMAELPFSQAKIHRT